ncbi:MAG TPA: hypothetical protein VMG14_01385 [Thermoplasmata archaeon]|nr:hypothetical protein [Thermoplasmata archaeon]HTW76405.1 hypothetical protein [Thermoplasmata archaeon]
MTTGAGPGPRRGKKARAARRRERKHLGTLGGRSLSPGELRRILKK